MVAIKRAGVKSREVKTGFESYDGPEPTKSGMYRAKIVAAKYKRFRENDEGVQNEGLVISVLLEAQKGDPKKHRVFDGWPKTTNLVFMDKEAMIARESNFYAALGVKDEPTIDIVKGDLEKGVKVNKIGGKDPIGVYVNVDLKPDRDTSRGLTIDGIYKFRDDVKFEVPEEDETDEDDLMDEEDEDLSELSLAELRARAKDLGIKTVGLKKDDLIDAITDAEADAEEEAEDDEDDPEDEDEGEFEEREEELGGMSIPELREILKELGGKTTGLKKDGLVEAILDLEFPDEEDDEDEDEDDEEDDEDDEEDEDEFDEDARREELGGMNRVALRKILQGYDPDATTKKSETDEDLVDRIIAIESTPF